VFATFQFGAMTVQASSSGSRFRNRQAVKEDKRPVLCPQTPKDAPEVRSEIGPRV
jgi:hypothetical protein